MTVCKDCFKKDHREFAGSRSNGGRKVFVNAEGQRWHGFSCPKCASNQKNPAPYRRKPRKCGVCKKNMAPDRYFNHKECIANRTEIYDDEYTVHL